MEQQKRPKGRGRGRGSGSSTPQSVASPPDVEGAMASLTVSEKSKSTTPKFVQDVEEEHFTAAMRRPNLGTKGRKINLVTNHFPVTIPKDSFVQHYDMMVLRKYTTKNAPEEWKPIERLPKYLGTLIYEKLIAENKDSFPNKFALAFDGNKNIFSKAILKTIDKTGKEFKVTVRKEDKNVDETFLVRIKHVAQVPLDLKQVFDRNMVERKSVSTLVLDVVLKQTTMFDVNFIPINRRIFYYPDGNERYPLGGGLVRFPGYWQSIRPVSGWKAMLNLDQANTAFVEEGPVLELVRKLDPRFNPKNVPQNQIGRLIRTLKKMVVGVKVNMTQRRDHRTAKCIGVSHASARQTRFPVTLAGSNQQQDITVEQYFNQMFKNGEFVRNVQYPDLPCLQVGSPNKRNYIPIEFCEVKKGQRYPRKLDDRQTSEMLKVASQSAPDRKRKIQADADFMKFDQDKYMNAFGFTVSLKMADVVGRVLTAPNVEYKNQKVTPNEGGWNMRNVKLIEGCRIRNFAAIVTTSNCDDRMAANFLSSWVREARNLGMRVDANTPSQIGFEAEADKLPDYLKNMKQNIRDLDLVFIVLEGQNTDFYGQAKAGGDVKYGVNTQCVQLKNVQRAQPAMLSNLCLKINGKLGGVNNKLVDTNKKDVKFFLDEPILFLGADVNHPSPGESDEPISCAAVVGNVDLYPSLYCARILLQHREETKQGETTSTKRPQEWIAGMKDAVKMTIEHFVERNGILPWRIIMYRDGVGETMFLQVLTKELTAIRQACDDMGQRFPDLVKKIKGVKKYEPPITFIVVQKRHHTRLFCADAKEEMGRGRNVPPGTTVDTVITHPEEFDFYLCSHLGIQGTSRPAHYHVLHDDSSFSADDLQLLTYYLCHTYVRATRSVSIPPPCYYADLVAYRARKYLESRMSGSSDTASVSTTASRSSALSLRELQQFVNVDSSIVKKGMFFV